MNAKNTSMFSLTQDFEDLLIISELGYDPRTGEAFEPDDIDKAFAELEAASEDKIAGTAFVLKRLKGEAALVKAEIDRLQAKKRSIENGHERLADLLRDFMRRTKLMKVKHPTISVSLGKPTQRVKVLDESKLAGIYIRTKTEPNKSAIKKDLEEGIQVKGAELEDGPERLTIR